MFRNILLEKKINLSRLKEILKLIGFYCYKEKTFYLNDGKKTIIIYDKKQEIIDKGRMVSKSISSLPSAYRIEARYTKHVLIKNELIRMQL